MAAAGAGGGASGVMAHAAGSLPSAGCQPHLASIMVGFNGGCRINGIYKRRNNGVWRG
jgi:hypothetical protein